MNTALIIALKPRQRAVLHLILEGQSNQQIADTLGISINTAKLYVHEIARILDRSGDENHSVHWWIKVARQLGRAEGRADVVSSGICSASSSSYGVNQPDNSQ